MKTIIINYWKQAISGACMMLLTLAVFSQSEEWVSYEDKARISAMLNDGENLWIAAGSGLFQLNMETEAVTSHDLGLPDLPRLQKLIKDGDGNLWITTLRNGIVKYDGRNLAEHYNQSNSDLASSQYCTSIAVDAGNSKWIGSLLRLNKFDGNSWESWTTPMSSVAAYWFIYDLKFDRNGDLWMGGDAPEWCFAKFTGGEIQPVPEITNAVNRILIDQDDNKWLATRQGLIKYDGTTFIAWNTGNSDLPDNDIRDIKQDASGNLWLACGRYPVRFDGRNAFTVYQVPPPVQENKERDPVSGKPFPENSEISTILCLELDDRGNIWFGTESSGLFKFTQVQESFRQVLSSPTSIQAVSGKNANSDFFVCGAGSELSVDFLLSDAAKVSLSVFDMQGREIVSFVKQSQLSAGQYSYSIKQAKGIYLVEYIAGGNVSVKKVVVQ